MNLLYMYLSLFFQILSQVDHYRLLIRVPRAIQQVLISYLFYIAMYIFLPPTRRFVEWLWLPFLSLSTFIFSRILSGINAPVLQEMDICQSVLRQDATRPIFLQENGQYMCVCTLYLSTYSSFWKNSCLYKIFLKNYFQIFKRPSISV